MDDIANNMCHKNEFTPALQDLSTRTLWLKYWHITLFCLQCFRNSARCWVPSSSQRHSNAVHVGLFSFVTLSLLCISYCNSHRHTVKLFALALLK